MADDWTGILAALSVMAVVFGVAWRFAFHGGEARRTSLLTLPCPERHAAADVLAVQDVRTGQWKGITACSLLAEPKVVDCGGRCAGQANLGTVRPVLIP